MATRLLQYYTYIAGRLGLEGKKRLAQETRIPATRAAVVPDSQINIETFREAVERLTGEDAPKF